MNDLVATKRTHCEQHAPRICMFEIWIFVHTAVYGMAFCALGNYAVPCRYNIQM